MQPRTLFRSSGPLRDVDGQTELQPSYAQDRHVLHQILHAQVALWSEQEVFDALRDMSKGRWGGDVRGKRPRTRNNNNGSGGTMHPETRTTETTKTGETTAAALTATGNDTQSDGNGNCIPSFNEDEERLLAQGTYSFCSVQAFVKGTTVSATGTSTTLPHSWPNQDVGMICLGDTVGQSGGDKSRNDGRGGERRGSPNGRRVEGGADRGVGEASAEFRSRIRRKGGGGVGGNEGLDITGPVFYRAMWRKSGAGGQVRVWKIASRWKEGVFVVSWRYTVKKSRRGNAGQIAHWVVVVPMRELSRHYWTCTSHSPPSL